MSFSSPSYVRVLSLSLGLFFICLAASAQAYPMVDNPHGCINQIRHGVLQHAHDVKKKIKLPSWLIGVGMFFGYDSQTRANVTIARPFFIVPNADNCLSNIGSDEADCAYLRTVFAEFTASGEQSLTRLIILLHQNMMRALNYSNMSLSQFRDLMSKTNKRGYPVVFDPHHFAIYCRCVARGLYAVYWFNNYR